MRQFKLAITIIVLIVSLIAIFGIIQASIFAPAEKKVDASDTDTAIRQTSEIYPTSYTTALDPNIYLEDDGEYSINFLELTDITSTFENKDTYIQLNGLNDEALQSKVNSILDIKQSFTDTSSSLNEVQARYPISYSSCRYTRSSEPSIKLKNKRYLSFALEIFEYSCGAHGNGGTMGKVIDLTIGEFMNLDDIFKDDNYLDTTYRKVREKLCKLNNFSEECASITDIYQTGETNSWLLKGTEPTLDNYRSFYLTKYGIVFVFNIYQIAPYAYGPSEVLITYDELDGFLDLTFD